MSIEECRQIILDNFRSFKLEKDHAQFQLVLFQILDLISLYEKLIELQEEIQIKHCRLIKLMENHDLVEDFDLTTWHMRKSEELRLWKCELDILQEYKIHINTILQQIEDGTAEQILIKQEKDLVKDNDKIN